MLRLREGNICLIVRQKITIRPGKALAVCDQHGPMRLVLIADASW